MTAYIPSMLAFLEHCPVPQHFFCSSAWNFRSLVAPWILGSLGAPWILGYLCFLACASCSALAEWLGCNLDLWKQLNKRWDEKGLMNLFTAILYNTQFYYPRVQWLQWVANSNRTRLSTLTQYITMKTLGLSSRHSHSHCTQLSTRSQWRQCMDCLAA